MIRLLLFAAIRHAASSFLFISFVATPMFHAILRFLFASAAVMLRHIFAYFDRRTIIGRRQSFLSDVT